MTRGVGHNKPEREPRGPAKRDRHPTGGSCLSNTPEILPGNHTVREDSSTAKTNLGGTLGKKVFTTHGCRGTEPGPPAVDQKFLMGGVPQKKSKTAVHIHYPAGPSVAKVKVTTNCPKLGGKTQPKRNARSRCNSQDKGKELRCSRSGVTRFCSIPLLERGLD